MKTVGIIVEYNPLHNGHVYHFQQSKIHASADAVIAVMSGNFLQRGEPAFVNKWARAEMALRMGVDLVIELPIAFAAQPAEWFAYGACSALHHTGVVDSLCFGSESGDLTALQELARQLAHEPESFKPILKRHLKKGINYPAAYSLAIQELTGMNNAGDEAFDLGKPNNILGLHYLIALERLQSDITPLTITRQKSEYHQQTITDQKIASATAIRKLFMQQNEAAAKQDKLSEIKPYVPSYTHEILREEWLSGRAPMHWDRFASPLLHQLLILPGDHLAQLHEVNEGLENRLKQALSRLHFQPSLSIDALLTELKTKRYTRTKLQRTLLHILLQHAKSELTGERLHKGVSYLRVLGFSDRGRQLLKRMKQTATVPVIDKVSRAQFPDLELDIRAASVYAAAYPMTSAEELNREFTQAPIYFSGNAAK